MLFLNQHKLVVLSSAPILLGLVAVTVQQATDPAPAMKTYYAHEVHEDTHGVIAPWYPGLNGQVDERVQIAVNVYKRYPWVGTDKAVMAAPDFVYNSHWSISPEGEIAIPPTTDWMCGDLSQRAWSIVRGLTSYYMYSGDPVAYLYIPLTVDYILDYAQTDDKNPWPRFPIATPTKGKAYGKCDPTGRNQLDLCAITGQEVLRAYKLTGNKRYLDSVKHWGDLFAEKCNFDTNESPWNRYSDPSVVDWSDVFTGGNAIITDFLDDLIHIGYVGKNGAILKARNRGRQYVNDTLFPKWLQNDTWGRVYWDWDNPTMCGGMFTMADHIMKYPKAYPTWKTDLRNVMGLVINRNGADAASMGDAYSGAWAFPESSVCCGTSLSYCQYTAAPSFIRFGVLANDPWAKEIGRRMMLMATYDSDENGVVKDGLLGQAVATSEWSNLAHPWPLCQAMEAISWMPREFAPNRENHIVRSSSVVSEVSYQAGRIAYKTFDAKTPAIDVLRLSFVPRTVQGLAIRNDLGANGYTVEKLPNGDAIVTIRHDGVRSVVVEGPDPQKQVGTDAMSFTGLWAVTATGKSTQSSGAEASYRFRGNQVRLLGTVGPDYGWADAYIDGQKQKTIVECWNPVVRHRQPIFFKKGLTNGEHELRIVARGTKNPLSRGALVTIDGAQSSDATGTAGYGSGGGPATAQRMIFGYPKRADYVDSNGHSWRPATEWMIRTGFSSDTVDKAWWTQRRSMYIGGTKDEELYRYGAHGKDFWVNVTVAPGVYDLRMRFADAALTAWMEREGQWQRVLRSVRVTVNGQPAIPPTSISEAAGGLFKAWDRELKGVRPEHGMIRIHVTGPADREACMQALEVVPAAN